MSVQTSNLTEISDAPACGARAEERCSEDGKCSQPPAQRAQQQYGTGTPEREERTIVRQRSFTTCTREITLDTFASLEVTDSSLLACERPT